MSRILGMRWRRAALCLKGKAGAVVSATGPPFYIARSPPPTGPPPLRAPPLFGSLPAGLEGETSVRIVSFEFEDSDEMIPSAAPTRPNWPRMEASRLKTASTMAT